MKATLPNTKRALIDKASSSIFLAVAAASIVVAFSVVAINFMWDLAGYNDRVNDAKEVARDTLIDNIDNAVELRASFTTLEAAPALLKDQGKKTNSAVVLDALPRKYDFPALRTSIDKLAELSGVKLSSVRGSDQEESAIQSMVVPEPQEIQFSVAVEGSYKVIKKFVDNLEKTIRPMRITKIRMSGSDDSMSVNIDISTYYQPSVDIQVQTERVE